MKILGAQLFSLNSKRLRLILSEAVDLVQYDGTKRKSQIVEISLTRLAVESGDEIAGLLNNTVVEKVPAITIAMAFIGVICDVSITDYKAGDVIATADGKTWTCEQDCSQVHVTNLNRQNWRFESQVMASIFKMEDQQFENLKQASSQMFTAPSMA